MPKNLGNTGKTKGFTLTFCMKTGITIHKGMPYDGYGGWLCIKERMKLVNSKRKQEEEYIHEQNRTDRSNC